MKLSSIYVILGESCDTVADANVYFNKAKRILDSCLKYKKEILDAVQEVFKAMKDDENRNKSSFKDILPFELNDDKSPLALKKKELKEAKIEFYKVQQARADSYKRKAEHSKEVK